ncbi:MAG TPA: hypothetical protein VL240_12425 [Candidatus Binatia bacterium]|nr:hypothetical protein [Candidatus Binatia bacterium]
MNWVSRLLLGSVVSICVSLSACPPAVAQSASSSAGSESSVPARTLERDFFAAIRSGDSNRVLSWISQRGVNVGPQGEHRTREEVQQQFLARRGLYCRLFDSSCIDAPIRLDNSARTCSDRDLLTHSASVRTASSEVTRNGVRQAILVAEVRNDQCASQRLIDFIFNLEADGWKLFSIP